MTVNIHGKEYKTVAERVSEFRESHPDYTIFTEIISAADIVQMKASILNVDGRVISTGFAEEVRGSTNINKTSALENCETSAIGRALASFGLSGSEYASANEVTDAIIQQGQQKVAEFYVAHNAAVAANLESIICIKQALACEDYSTAKEAWSELGEDIQRALWVAPSKGGMFTTRERETMKTTEFREA